MWRIDWGKRFPEGNKDVISRGCPFSMSQVKHCLLFQFTHLVCAGIRADGRKIQNYSYFFEPHVSLFIQSYWNPPKQSPRFRKRENRADLCVNLGIPLTTKFHNLRSRNLFVTQVKNLFQLWRRSSWAQAQSAPTPTSPSSSRVSSPPPCLSRGRSQHGTRTFYCKFFRMIPNS